MEKTIHGHEVTCSKLIKGMKYLTEPSFYPGSCGDIWCWTWADDDNIYLFGGDESTIDKKIGLPIKVEGIPPRHKCIALGSRLSAGNFPPKRSFLENTDYWTMPSGAICIDGRIYLFVNKNLENPISKENNLASIIITGIHYPHYQPVSKAYLLYSDNHGATFIGNAKDKDPEFFPHKFGWPTFINFARNLKVLFSSSGGSSPWSPFVISHLLQLGPKPIATQPRETISPMASPTKKRAGYRFHVKSAPICTLFASTRVI